MPEPLPSQVPQPAAPPAPSAQPFLKSRTAKLLFLFLLAIVPFLPAINGAYIWDDDAWLVNNPAVHAWNGLLTIWNPFRQSLHFYPITFSTLWLEHKLWALDPAGYHATNMLFHATATLLLYLCLKRLGLRAAWLGALLWAIHPVQVESVAWVAEIKNVLSGIFFFLAAWSYLKFEQIDDSVPAIPDPGAPPLPRNYSFYALSLFAFTLALLTKTVTVVLPALLLLILWARGGKIRRALPLLLPFLALGLAIAAFTAGQERRVMEVGGASNLDFSIAQRIIIAGKDVWFYLRTLLVPFPLLEIYPRWTCQTSDVLNYLPALGVLILAITLYALRSRLSRWPIAIFACFIAALAPALGFINFFTMHYTFVADHYQYLASACILPFAAELFARATASTARFINRPFIIASAASILLLMAATAFYSSLYQTSLRLWSWNVEYNPDAFTAQHNLGVELLNTGHRDEAIKHIYIALQQAPDDDNIQRTVGKLALQDKKFDEAIDHLSRAVALRPNYAPSYVLLGDAYDRMGHLDDAIAHYRKAIEVSPYLPDGYIALAPALKKKHQFDEATKAYETAITLDPGNLITRYNYANLLLDMNRWADAITIYKYLLQYQPNNPAVWDNLAYAYHQLGQDNEALAARQRAILLESSASPSVPASATQPPPG